MSSRESGDKLLAHVRVKFVIAVEHERVCACSGQNACLAGEMEAFVLVMP